MKAKQDYLGDSVYVAWDGHYITLTTNNGYPDDPRNIIALEPTVYRALLRFVAGLSRQPGDNIAARISEEGGDEMNKWRSEKTRVHFRTDDGWTTAVIDMGTVERARKIAAAPDLLEACKEAVADAEQAVNPSARLPNYESMKAAIAKAEEMK